MKELNLTVGQKVWSIQLAECEVIEINNEEYGYIIEGKYGDRYSFDKFGRYSNRHENPSLFESNPFVATIQLPQGKTTLSENKPENKAELINAMCAIINTPVKAELKDIAKEKLQKLLESI